MKIVFSSQSCESTVSAFVFQEKHLKTPLMNNYNDLLKVPPTGLLPKEGRLLISSPYYNDTFFNRSVVLLTDITADATAGLIINKQLPYTVREMVGEIRVDEQIYFGGPVMPEGVFLIHSFNNCKESSRLLDNVYVGYNPVLLSLIEHNAIPNLRRKFLLGYAGWAKGQLESEILNDMWVVAEGSYSTVFNTPANLVWETAVANLGDKYSHWLRMPEKIGYN